MLAEELVVCDAGSPLWNAIQPLLNAALRLEQQSDDYTWYGWKKVDITAFLRHLPVHCSLLIGVWEVGSSDVEKQTESSEQETLVLGCVCEVRDGEVSSIRSFHALAGLPPLEHLEPGLSHALELMRLARAQVASVAWAIFTDKETWDTWLFTESAGGATMDKGELLATLAQQGRCVLLGSQAAAHHQ